MITDNVQLLHEVIHIFEYNIITNKFVNILSNI